MVSATAPCRVNIVNSVLGQLEIFQGSSYGDEVILIAFYSIPSLNGNLFMIFASRNKASDAEIGLGGIS